MVIGGHLAAKCGYTPAGRVSAGAGYAALPDHQMAVRPPSPQSIRRVTARTPLWLYCGRNCSAAAPTAGAEQIAQTNHRFVDATVLTFGLAHVHQ